MMKPVKIPFEGGEGYRPYLLFAECLQRGHLAIADKIWEKYGHIFPSVMESLTMFGFAIWHDLDEKAIAAEEKALSKDRANGHIPANEARES